MGKENRPHIYLGSTGKAESFTTTSGGGGNTLIPSRNRQNHFNSLSKNLEDVKKRQEEIKGEASNYELEAPLGLQIEFENFEGVELAVESLANEQQKIELLSVVTRGNKTTATIFVPIDKLSFIESKLQAYINEKKNKNGDSIDHQKLIDAIQSFRTAAFEALWTDTLDKLPDDFEQDIWWEVWLPVRGNRNSVLHDFTHIATELGIEIAQGILKFPERSIILAKGTRQQFSENSLLLNNISEIRRAKETAAFFDSLSRLEQQTLTDDLLQKLELPKSDSSNVCVCILDTGVNTGNPLLSPFINEDHQYSIESDWTATDDDGHGTSLAGLSLWGDLTEVAQNDSSIKIDHTIESVKLLRYSGDNEGKHLGVVTSSGVSLPNIEDPSKTRIYAMALSAEDGRDKGKPSAWSSTIDSLAVDYLGDNESPKLFTLCAGNAGDDLVLMMNYPDNNLVQDVRDPAQAWNALTIGSYTEKVIIDDEGAEDYQPLAPSLGLSPFSTTSKLWDDGMPVKPEVVFEGGNAGVDATSCAAMPSLSLLTTSHDIQSRLLTTSYATSASTALASRFAAQLYVRYPKFWPETIRGLMVHSAEWTDEMTNQFNEGSTNKEQAKYRVQCVGYGVPNLTRAMWSADNSLSLIIEDELQPFHKDGSDIKTKDMHLHELPWPKETLLELGETDVRLTVTLSYFVEPNPSSRAKGKYSYQSHGLSFDVKRRSESVDEFRKRINREAKSEGDNSATGVNDPDWVFGSQFRNKGSIHKDIWTGKAVDLAERGQLAVYPAMGWWRTRPKLEKYEKLARYSLIVTISVPDVETDIYSEVVTTIPVETLVEV